MKNLVVDLKKEFPFLQSKQEVMLHCYVNDNASSFAPDRMNPAILIAPGGAYSGVCFEREGESIAFPYLSAGFSAFWLHYSVAPERYPAQVLEAAASMLYIRAHAKEWHVDPEKIAICGFSAGGHLAASLGVFWNDPFLCDMMKVSPRDVRPDAMVLGYPLITSDISFSHRGCIQNLTGLTDPDAPLYKKMALETHVKEDTPPTFLWHTAEDAGVPVRNSLAFAAALSMAHVPFELHVYPYGPHGLATADYATNAAPDSPFYYAHPWLEESVKFLKSRFF